MGEGSDIEGRGDNNQYRNGGPDAEEPEYPTCYVTVYRLM